MLRTLHAEVSKGPQQDGVLHSGVKFCNSLRFCACNDLELFDIFCPGMQFIIQRTYLRASQYIATQNFRQIFPWTAFPGRNMAAGFLPTLFLRKQRSPIMIKGTLEQLSTGRAISNKVEEQFANGLSIKAFRYPK